MPSLRGPTGRVAWPLLAGVASAEFAALSLAWALTHSSWLQGALLIVCLLPLRILSVRAADTNPFPSRSTSETKQLDWLLIVSFFVLLLGLGAGLSQTLKALDIYPGRYAVAYIAAWVPLAIAWNLVGYQREPDAPGDAP